MPKIIMINTAVLKETLSKKVAEQAVTAVANQVHGAVAERAAAILQSPSLSVVLTFSIPLQEVQPQIERIQALVASLGLQNDFQYQPPSLVAPLASIQTGTTIEISRATSPAITNTRQSENGGLPTVLSYRGNRTEPSTDKQQQLLQRLAIKRHLSTAAIKQLLLEKYGVETGVQLSKKQASELINAWIVR